ncbi:MAG: hypothetical protein WAT79_17575 [Saprospiraceae bacterium]
MKKLVLVLMTTTLLACFEDVQKDVGKLAGKVIWSILSPRTSDEKVLFNSIPYKDQKVNCVAENDKITLLFQNAETGYLIWKYSHEKLTTNRLMNIQLSENTLLFVFHDGIITVDLDSRVAVWKSLQFN